MVGSETAPEPVAVWDVETQGIVWVSLRRTATARFSTECPECGMGGPHISVNERPAKYRDELNEVFVCGNCSAIWSPKPAETRIMRQSKVEVGAEALDSPVEIQRVLVPYPRRNYLCPSCETPITTRQQRRLGRPALHAHELNDVLRCPFCMHYFSPKVREATVIRS